MPNTILFSSLVAIILGLIGVIADVCIKKAGSGRAFMDVPWFVAGLTIYAMTAFGWFYVMKHLKLSTVGVFYSLTSVLFLLLAGMLFFGERLNVMEWIGVALAILSLVLLTKFA